MNTVWRVALCRKCDELRDFCLCDDSPDVEWIYVARVRIDTHATHEDFVGEDVPETEPPF